MDIGVNGDDSRQAGYESAGAGPEGRTLQNRTMRTVFWKIMPVVFVCYVVAYLDRVNVGVAALTMTKDLGLTPSQFGMSAGAFFLGFFIAEIPSNLAMQRFGARRWLARIMITWGICSAATAFATGPVSFSVLRFLLGLAEAGFSPGVFLYMAYWFPAQYRGRAVASFMLALPVANIVGSPVSSSLLGLHGLAGLAGWQWLLVLEAVPAVVLGFVCLFVLTDGPEKARWLPDDGRAWLAGVLAFERAEIERHNRTTLRSALINWRILMFAAVNFFSVIGSVGVALWIPQILHGLHVSVGRVGFVVAIPYLCGGAAMIYCGRRSDRLANRAIIPIGGLLLSSVGLVLSSILGSSLVPEVAALCVAVTGLMIFQGTIWPLPMSILSGRAAAAGLAMIISIGNLGGFAGPSLIGWARQLTGSFDLALLIVAGSVLFSALLLIILCRTLGRRQGAAAEPAADVGNGRLAPVSEALTRG